MAEPILSSTSLAYFVKIAEVGSFTAAARELRVSQPSLSVAIRKLEEDLDTTLLVRGRRGVTLTSTGEALLRHARHALRTLSDAREEIHGLESEPRGHFTIGVHESLAAYALPTFMAKFLATHLGVRLSLWNGTSREVERAVVSREVDLGLVVNPDEHPDCVVKKLFTDRVEFIVASSLKKKHKRPLPALIESHALIYTPVIAQVMHLVHELGRSGPTPRQELHCSSLELVKSLVLDGVGVGVLPYRVATYGVEPGRVVTVAPALPCYIDTIALVRRFDMHETRAARLLLDGLRAHGEAMPALPKRPGKKKL